eukprot:TRINITY_DN36827_c0_g1_i1.p1 TRINITY_DN36827_c0_g1~~TRINITY_DN36827_c0_g1_i1.p1  ORF type:complete len:162 (+),score=28.54 TRINITY_DN36827_c0_g1_i1:50-487(+)
MNYVHQPYGDAPPPQQQAPSQIVYSTTGAVPSTLPTQTTAFGGLGQGGGTSPPGSSGVSPVLVPQGSPVPPTLPVGGAPPSPSISPSQTSKKNGSDRRASNSSSSSAPGLHHNNPHSRQVQVNGPDRPPLLYDPDTGVPIPHLTV